MPNLRESIVFQRRGAGAASPQQPDEPGIEPGMSNGEWATIYGPVRADITPLRGGEAVMAGRLAGRQSYLITVRSSCGARDIVMSDQAVKTRTGEAYNLLSVQNPDKRNIWLVFTAETGVVTG